MTTGSTMKYRVKIRRGPGWDVRPEAESLDGKIFSFTSGWTIEDGIYKGETAMIIEGPFNSDYPNWIASGDLQLLDDNDE